MKKHVSICSIFCCNARMNEIYESIRANSYIKDKKGRYIFASDGLIQDADLSLQDIIGKTDIDLPWVHLATEIMNNDQNVILQKNTITIIESANDFQGKRKLFLSHKTPYLCKQGKIIGISGISIPLPETYRTDLTTFSLREKQCIYYLLRGYSAKKTGNELNISSKTVEFHLTKLKIKLNCHSTITH